MPQADIGIVSSTVFFLFLSFILGYFVWVNFIFPQVIVLLRVKQVVTEIKEKDFTLSTSDNTSTRLSVSPKNYFSLIPAIILDLPSDEVPLLINFVLISLSFYFILSTILEKSHNDSKDFVKSLCDFDFSDSIKSLNDERSSALKYSRSASLLGLYEISLKWISSREHLVLPIVVSSVNTATTDLLNDISNKVANKKTNKLSAIFNKVKTNSNKAATLLLLPSEVKTFRLKK